jgi:parvulin-like peptidyl-prolyl isomerase
MYRLFVALMLIVAAVYMNGCGISDDAVAKVGGSEIKVDQFKTELGRRFRGKTSFADVDSTQKMTILNRMILTQLKVNAAYDLNLDEDESLQNELDDQKGRLLGNRYFEKIIVDKLISEEDIKASFEKQKEEVKASHILLSFIGASRSKATRTKEESKKLAEELILKIKSGQELSELAQEYSDDPSAKKNKGDLGYFSWGKMVGEFQEAAFSMQPGEISDPVLTSYGYHIIKVEDRRANPKFKEDDFEKQKFQIKRKMYSTYQDSGRKMWEANTVKLKEDKDFKILDENIEKLNEIAAEKDKAGLVKISDYTDDEKDILLAEWKGGKFLVKDLFKLYGKRFDRVRKNLTKKEAIKKDAEDMSFHKILIAEAESMGIHKEKEISEKLTQFIEQRIARLVEKKEINDKINIDDDVLMKYYEENKKDFATPATIEIWEVYVKDEKVAKKVAKLAKKGRDFEKLVKKYSEDVYYKKKNGYLGYKDERGRGPISKKAFELGEGNISDPVKYRGGWTVIKTGKMKPEAIKSFDDSRQKVTSKLRSQKLRERRTEWENELREKYTVTINQKLVNTI